MSRGGRFKDGLKGAAKTVAHRMGTAKTPGDGPSRILTYHSVGTRDHAMNVTPEAFREQMNWLAAHYTVAPVAETLERSGVVAITFDDGYRDNLYEAAPILEAYELPATVFVVTGRLGRWLDHDRPTADAQLMSWDEVRALHDEGVALGAHTITHRRLSALPLADQRAEIAGSVRALAEQFGALPAGFAYPYGSALDYTSETVEVVQSSGVQYALSNRYGPVAPDEDRWAVRRIWIDRTDTLATFQAKVSGRLDGLALFDHPAAVLARRLLNRVLRA